MRGRALTEAQVEHFLGLVESGCTIVECARKLGIGRSTLFALLRKNKTLQKRVAEARQVCDDDVQGSLYRLATRVRHFVPTCTNRHAQGAGRAVCEDCGQVIEVEVSDADYRAIEFWLTNRQRDKWRKRWSVENVVRADTVVEFAGEIAGAINDLVADVEIKRALVEAIERAAMRFDREPPLN